MSLILGIETSCDETAAAIVLDGKKVVSSTLATSRETHMKTGGVVPEVAARMQVESIVPVIETCFKEAGIKKEDLTAVAVTVGPGLVGSLIVGVEAAKALAFAWDKPIVPVNHLVGHIYGNFINQDPLEIGFPSLVLIVSGGHTDLVLMKDHGKFEYIGGTLDDAAGEAFDKVGRMLGIAPYLGGPLVSKLAEKWRGRELSFRFKRPMIDSGDYNFSFSGIKTAVFARVKRYKEGLNSGDSLSEDFVAETAFEFQEAVTDVLMQKTVKAAKEYNVKSVMLAGGVSANEILRQKFENIFVGDACKLFIPPINLCTDNAVYIAACAHYNFYPKPFDQVVPDPSFGVMSVA